MTNRVPQQLALALSHPLPGAASQRPLEPDLAYGRHAGIPTADARQAAVMILLFPRDGVWYLPLTVRPAHLLDHGGQISLPGGSLEYGESSCDAARRELREELGIDQRVEILGRLSDLFVFVSNFRVVPWVGAIDHDPNWRPCGGEVTEVLEIPLNHFSSAEHRCELTVRRHGLTFCAPCFRWQEHRIWGATAMILSELVAVTTRGEELWARHEPHDLAK